MILTYKDCRKLAGTPWKMLELRSDHTTEKTLHRLGSQIPGICGPEPLEIFVPVTRRDLDTYVLETVNYIYARGKDSVLFRLKNVTGVVGLVTTDDTQSMRKAVSVPDEYVQERIKALEAVHRDRGSKIVCGSFVRILDGETRDYCGTIVSMSSGMACVLIELKTKQMLIETPVGNLVDLSSVPVQKRVFYYNPLVDAVHEALIREDLVHAPPEVYKNSEVKTPYRRTWSRAQTASAMVVMLVSNDHKILPLHAGIACLKAMKDGLIRPVKNLNILYCIIKEEMLLRFRKESKKIKNWRSVIREKGAQYKFVPRDLVGIEPGLNLGETTENPKQDCRSKEGRARLRQREEDVKRMHAEGKSASEIARAIQMQPQSVILMLKRLGLEKASDGRATRWHTGIDYQARNQQVKDLHLAGKSHREIGNLMGLDSGTVSYILVRKFGLKTAPQNRKRL